ncbi:general secretion pathway protein D [Nitrosospira sp. Nsp5]|uniref:General secretion pathway protein D n=1 Tax=Nitrosospira multiformis TaxID=1231 RepID=A0ABY0T973_9PROT|nr:MULTISPECIES: secretin N-terminal domain-containing protein [Nitrosospira]PTR08018.1 general secretion pathway protein D [Nitrosospira sp. Nsp5]SDQ46873.1 general secretion pathway protein D [Nitrosospira multiformis]
MNSTFGARSLAVCVLMLMISSCAFSPWPKEGVPGDTPEERIANADAARRAKPEDMPTRRDVHVTHERAVYELLQEADRALRDGRTAEAEAFFARVLFADPANARALTGQHAITSERKHADRVESARNLLNEGNLDAAQAVLRTVLLETPSHGGALELQGEIRRKREFVRNEPPRLKSPFDKPISLELRDANIKMVFEALSRTTGINFILDKDIKQDAKATVFVSNARIEDAIEMVLATNGLQKKALSETTALVFPNTLQKLKDYQDLMIRSFFLTNASAKHVSALLKTMLKSKDVHIDERLNMLVIRDTPEVIRIAEKLVAANDMADPEVMLEIDVLEISRNRLQELGIAWPTTLTSTAGLTLSAITANMASAPLEFLTINQNAQATFRKVISDINILANPRVRVRNNEKARVQVGDKIPLITTNVAGTTGTSSESVQYIDVGLKLEVEPRIALDNHVHIKVGLEVSSLGVPTVLTNGSRVFQIGTRNANTLLRLKDGETQVLAGLISDDERKNASRVPGLGDLPVLGRLFSNQEDKKNKTEIVLAITPRVINNIRRPESELSEYWSGTELSINDRPQIVVPGAGGSGTGRNSSQRPSLPIEQPLPQEVIQDQPQTPAAPSPAVSPPADSSSPAGGGQPQPPDPFRSPTNIP